MTATHGLSARDKALYAYLRAAERPMSAYALLDARRHFEPRIAPTTIYRSLAKLEKAGLAQRVASLKAWIPRSSVNTAGVLAICDSCGTVEEVTGATAVTAVTKAVALSGFHPARPVIEVHVHCPRCESDPATRSVSHV